MKNKCFVIFSFLFIFFGLILFSQVEEVKAGEQLEELTVAIHTDENTLTPYTYVMGYPGMEVMRWIYDSLFIMDPDNEPVPWMAAEYEVDEEYRVFEIGLHEDLKWHDGVRVTAEDVRFSFLYALEQNRSRWISISNQIEDIETEGEYYVKITLKESNPDFILQGLADFPIIPKHIYDDLENAEEVPQTIGSGPYKLTEYRPGQFYRFEAVDDYFLGMPKVEKIVMPIMTDTSSIFQALRAGQIDATTAQLAPELVENFENDPSLKIMAGTGFSSTLLQFNSEEYPFNEKKFRQAISYALDVDEIVETVILGYGDRGSLGFFHPDLPWARDDLLQKRDLELSNSLLDELGFTERNNGDIRLDAEGNALEFELLVYANNPLRIRTAELVAEQLEEVGIAVNIKSLETGTVDDLVWPGFDVSQGRDFQMSMWGWSAPVQTRMDSLVDLMASEHDRGTLNIGGFESREFDELAAGFNGILDSRERHDVVNEMQLVAAEEIPFITLYYSQLIAAFNAEVYDGWKIQNGVGIINKFSLLSLEGEMTQVIDNVEPVEEMEDEGGSGTWVWIGIIAAALLIIAVGAKIRKNAK